MKRRARTKAIFVDGASAYVTKDALGIDEYDFPALRHFLAECVGTLPATEAPLITVGPRMIRRETGFVRDMRGAGFDIVPARSDNEADDFIIKERIRALSPSTIGEIVIFTSDRGFVPVLREKASRGMSIYWVSTQRHQPDLGRHRLSLQVLTLCTQPRFHFIELADYVQHIGRAAA
jgi:hypothetical protein